jgi:hypothetical protein
VQTGKRCRQFALPGDYTGLGADISPCFFTSLFQMIQCLDSFKFFFWSRWQGIQAIASTLATERRVNWNLSEFLIEYSAV